MPGLESSGLLNTREAARFLRVSEASIRRWSDANLLPVQRVGRRRERRFAPADLVRFLGQTTGGSQPASVQAATVNVGGTAVSLRTHLAPLYSTDLGGRRLSVPFLADGIRAGQPCFLVAAGAALDRYTRALDAEPGVGVDAAIGSGQLTVVGWPGATVPDVIANWELLFGRALAGGPTVLRVVGEMASERSMFRSEGEMMDYEEAYELMAKRFPVVTLCQYDAREFDGEIVLRVLKSHPDMFVQNVGAFLH